MGSLFLFRSVTLSALNNAWFHDPGCQDIQTCYYPVLSGNKNHRMVFQFCKLNSCSCDTSTLSCFAHVPEDHCGPIRFVNISFFHTCHRIRQHFCHCDPCLYTWHASGYFSTPMHHCRDQGNLFSMSAEPLQEDFCGSSFAVRR